MDNKNHSRRRKPRFQQIGLIFYCYLLIPLNELALKRLKIKQLKNQKKIIDISGVSIQNTGNEDSGIRSQGSGLPLVFYFESGDCHAALFRTSKVSLAMTVKLRVPVNDN